MRAALLTGLLFLQISLFAQNNDRFRISGSVTEEESQTGVSACNISVLSPSGFIYETISDTGGHYIIDNVNKKDSVFEIHVNKARFYGTRSKLIFHERPHDTILDIKIIYIPFSGDWFPDIHFKYNSSTPEQGFLDTLAVTVTYLKDNPRWKINVIGYKDSAETLDRRKERAELICKELIKQGINNNRLKIELSDKPNVLKPGRVQVDYKTGNLILTKLTEEYILSIPSVNDRESLRQLNRCVTFEVYGE
jgi:hypothetical protein